MKKIIIIILFLLFLIPAAILFLKGESAKNPGTAKELPHKVKCVKDLKYDNSIFYNTERTDNDIKTFLSSLTEVCLEKEHFCPMQGFLTEIYRKNPDKIDGWLKNIDIKSIQQAQALLVPLNTEENLELYRKYIKKHITDEKQQQRYIGYTLLEDENFMVQIPCHFEFLWGRYFAHKDTKYIDKILNCISPKPERYCMCDSITKQEAKEALTKAIKENKDVRAYIEKNLSEYDSELQKILKKAFKEEN